MQLNLYKIMFATHVYNVYVIVVCLFVCAWVCTWVCLYPCACIYLWDYAKYLNAQQLIEVSLFKHIQNPVFRQQIYSGPTEYD